jgi:hypothetical protein
MTATATATIITTTTATTTIDHGRPQDRAPGLEGSGALFLAPEVRAAERTITRVKQVEPRLTAAFRPASSESAHISRINRSDEGEP